MTTEVCVQLMMHKTGPNANKVIHRFIGTRNHLPIPRGCSDPKHERFWHQCRSGCEIVREYLFGNYQKAPDGT